MNAVERFINGKDRLSALLKAVPDYDAPASLKAHILHAAQSFETQMSPVFTPSESLRTAVLKEAQNIQQAQAVRRDAVLCEIAQQQSAESALGAPVSEETEQWLKEEALRKTSTPVAASSKTTSANRFWFRSRRFGFAFSFMLAMIGGATLHHFYVSSDDATVLSSISAGKEAHLAQEKPSESIATYHEATPSSAVKKMAPSRQDAAVRNTTSASTPNETQLDSQITTHRARAPLSEEKNISPPSALPAPEAIASAPAAIAMTPESAVPAQEAFSEAASTSQENIPERAKSKMVNNYTLDDESSAVDSTMSLEEQNYEQREKQRMQKPSTQPPPPPIVASEIQDQYPLMTITHPIDWPKWLPFAQAYMEAARDDQVYQWQLNVYDPDRDDVKKLAQLLRQHLPSGATLEVVVDKNLAEKYVRLELLTP